MSATVVLPCFCAHPGQDALHGAGKRVHNAVMVEKTAPPQYRCTVCERVRTADGRVS